MKMSKINYWLFQVMVFCALLANVNAQEQKQKSRFSHQGIKASIGSASFDMISERGLAEGEGGMLSLGYGFSDRFSLWLTLLGSEHPEENVDSSITDFSGIELNGQHRFETRSRWQPYAKVGVGLYGLESRGSNETLIGAGLNMGLGLDFFFGKHFGVGAEASYKKIDYFSKSVQTESGELIQELHPNLNGDTVGFMLTLTIQ
ncbi:MAG: outer membrane beta-barrel protein [bacterium]